MQNIVEICQWKYFENLIIEVLIFNFIWIQTLKHSWSNGPFTSIQEYFTYIEVVRFGMVKETGVPWDNHLWQGKKLTFLH